VRYRSTRADITVSGAQAIVLGISDEGGLFVPASFPRVDLDTIAAMPALDYAERVALTLHGFLDEFSRAELADMARDAYSSAAFAGNHPAPLHRLTDDVSVLELYHGPTLAFKDMALRMLPRLLPACAKLTGEAREILILVATSGDTGKAALSGFEDVPGTRCLVYYPKGGVSQAQRLQMVTQSGGNTHVIAVEGNFDDAQTGVKTIFASSDVAKRLASQGRVLSSANSINFGRLAPQIAYYFSAYADLIANGTIIPGDKVNFAVPTGNFGNILSAVYASYMGLPIGRLICASNENNVLSDFVATGEYDSRRRFYRTSSPSMDILVSSNLERMLFEMSGRDIAKLSGWMESLKSRGAYRVGAGDMADLRGLMVGGWADEDMVRAEISRVWSEYEYLIDPHTAVAMTIARDYLNRATERRHTVVVSTASPFKFGSAVAGALRPGFTGSDFECCAAMAEITGQPVPEAIALLGELPILHDSCCAVEDMERALFERLACV